jgi:ribonucleotide reductase alpha subunit
LDRLVKGLDLQYIDVDSVVSNTVEAVNDGIKTTELDNLLAETTAYFSVRHPDYSTLAGRVKVTALHKTTQGNFSDVIHALYSYVHPKTGLNSKLIDDKVYNFVMENKDKLNAAVQYERDLVFDYFGFKTLERSYLLRINNKVVERPQHLFMRVAVGIHQDDLQAALETYDLMSQGKFTHASPTLFNAGLPNAQMSSCTYS